MPSSGLFILYASPRLITGSGFLCVQCPAVLSVVLLVFYVPRKSGTQEKSANAECAINPHECPSCFLWVCLTAPNGIIPIFSLSPSARTPFLIQDFVFSSLQPSSLSYWSTIVAVQVPPVNLVCPCSLTYSQTLLSFIIEPKQNIDFSGVLCDLHLYNKIVSATNIHFLSNLMEIWFFTWE